MVRSEPNATSFPSGDTRTGEPSAAAVGAGSVATRVPPGAAWIRANRSSPSNRRSVTTSVRASGIQLGLVTSHATFSGVPPVAAIVYTHGRSFSGDWKAIRVPSGDQERWVIAAGVVHTLTAVPDPLGSKRWVHSSLSPLVVT